MSAKSNLVKNTLLLSICTMLNKGIMFIMIPLFSRWLTVEEYGNFDLLQTYIFLLIPIITLAINNGIFRLGIENDVDGKIRYISSGLFVIVINLIIYCCLICFFVYFRHSEHIAEFVFLSICSVFDTYFQGYLRSIKKLNIYALCQSFNIVCVCILSSIFILHFKLGLDGILLGYAFGYLFSDIAIFFITKFWRYFSVKEIKLSAVKELIQYSAPLIPNDISWWVINVFDRTVISIFLGPIYNGIYAISGKIPNFCSAIFSVFNISWQEAAACSVDDDDRNIYYDSIFNSLITCLLPLASIIVACDFVFFDFIFDQKYSDGYQYVPFLIAGIILNIFSQFFGGIQISFKNTKANGISTVLGASFSIFFLIISIRYLELYAAAISVVLANLIVMAIRVALIRKKYLPKISLKNIVPFAVFIYYFVSTYLFSGHFFIQCINLIIAIVIFCFLNKKLIIGLLKKVVR